MNKHGSCVLCDLSISDFKQITQEDLELLSEHISIKDTCEWCLLITLSDIETGYTGY